MLTARDWESRFVDAARRRQNVRIVGRAYEPPDLDRATPLDGVVLGSETSWITAGRIRALRRRNIDVVGIYPAGDRPGRDLLRSGGVDVALPDSTDPDDLLDAVALAVSTRTAPTTAGRLISVTGPRGAPGRTEVSVALGAIYAERAETAILDLDSEAPGVAFRLGLPPGPSLIDLVDEMRCWGAVTTRACSIRGLKVVGDSTPPATPPDRTTAAHLIDVAVTAYSITVADAGPWRPRDSLLTASDAVVLVCDAGPQSLIRAAAVARDWEGPPPLVIVNRVKQGGEEATVRVARRALGLEPHTLIPDVERLEPQMPRDHLRLLAADALATAVGRAVSRVGGP